MLREAYILEVPFQSGNMTQHFHDIAGIHPEATKADRIADAPAR
jgi:hypothetical protein